MNTNDFVAIFAFYFFIRIPIWAVAAGLMVVLIAYLVWRVRSSK